MAAPMNPLTMGALPPPPGVTPNFVDPPSEACGGRFGYWDRGLAHAVEFLPGVEGQFFSVAREVGRFIGIEYEEDEEFPIVSDF